MIIDITPEMREKSKELSQKIFGKEKKLGWKDKFKTGYELASDYVGFLGEMAFAEMYDLPEPKFLEKGKDDGDWTINGKVVDLKTKGERTKDFLLNRDQYERKIGEIDIFVFGEIYENYFRSVGWIEYERVPEISRAIIFPNSSRAWGIKKRQLNKMVDLFCTASKE